MGNVVTAVLLDTHVLHWWSAEPDRLSAPATAALEQASELLVAAVTWFELAWLARHERIAVTVPLLSWLGQLAEEVRTVGITPAVADTAVTLPTSFPGDPADRLIYATAIDHGVRLVTKDRKLRSHRHPTTMTIW